MYSKSADVYLIARRYSDSKARHAENHLNFVGSAGLLPGGLGDGNRHIGGSGSIFEV